ncbi:transporter [soil metagenome]
MKNNRILILWIWPIIGLGVNGVSYATDSRVDGYVPKSEYEKLKREVENEKLKREVENERLRREVETLKGYMQRLLEAAAATPEPKPSAAETKEEKQPVASAPPSSQESVGRSEREEFEVAKGDRRKEAEEAKRELDQFLRAQKLLFRPGKIQLEFGASYAHEAETSHVSPLGPVFRFRAASANFLMRYGLAEDLEFDFGVPLVYTEQERDSRPVPSTTSFPSFTRETGVGFGDINWAFRYAALHEDRGLPEVTLNVNAKADTGDEDRGLGTGHWNVGTGVSLVKTIDPVVLFGSLGYTWTLEQEDIDPGDQIPYSIGMGFSLNDRVSVSMAMGGAAIRRREINGNEISGSGLDINSLQFTTTVQLAKRVYVEPFVGFGLTDEAADFLVGINIPVGLEGRFPLPF